MLKALGFFHFRENVEDPIGLRRLELERIGATEDVSGSLIVLPEAFNLGVPYYGDTGVLGRAKIPLGGALENLQGIAKDRAVAFVAGLLGKQHNSAYWIGQKGHELLCHKMGDDRTGHYLPWSGKEGSDGCNPLEFENACLAALICLDAVECPQETQAARERRENLMRHVKQCGRPHRILCVPAQMGSYCDVPEVDGIYCILANANAKKSFVKNGCNIEVEPADQNRNEICLMPLARHEPVP
jgi:hypothetical protein